MLIKIDSIEDALMVLESDLVVPPASGSAQPVNIDLKFSGELGSLEVRIYGADYHGELHGELARGIASFQDEIYRATLASLKEIGIDQRRLSATQKELVELRFEVRDNCTLVKFDLGNLASGLKDVLIAMPPDLLVWVLVGSVALVVCGVAAVRLGGKHIDRLQAKDQLDHQQHVLAGAQQGETERKEIDSKLMARVVDALAVKAGDGVRSIPEKFENATENGLREMATRATGARAFRVGDVELDQDALQELRKRAPRTSPEQTDVVEDFKIVEMIKVGSPYRLTISSRTFVEIKVDFDEYEFEKEKADKVYEAFKTGGLIKLSVTMLSANDRIKFATVVDIDPEVAC